MTDEQINNHCQRCHSPEFCGYVTRGMQRKCSVIQDIDEGYDVGWEDAVKKACEWLAASHEDIGIRWVRGDTAEELVEQFKKAMEE